MLLKIRDNNEVTITSYIKLFITIRRANHLATTNHHDRAGSISHASP